MGQKPTKETKKDSKKKEQALTTLIDPDTVKRLQEETNCKSSINVAALIIML
jgi:hypothetical protein